MKLPGKHFPALLLLLAYSTTFARAADIVFPNDPRAILDVKRDCGAVGDGVADDTEALQKAIETASRTLFIYLPNGTYRITRTLVFRKSEKGGEGSMVGPWLFGQNREKTILRLADGAEGFSDEAKPLEMLRCLSRPDGAKMNADFFDRIVCNLTLDTGKNKGAVGIKFYSNNTGAMKDVTVRGAGVCGIDLGFNDQNGPLLIQDVEVLGFATGIRTNAILNSQTISRVSIEARETGLFHRGQVLAVEGLKVRGAPLAIDSGGNGVLTLVDAALEGIGAAGPAIKLEKGHLYASRVSTSGFGSAIAGPHSVSGAEVQEYSSHEVTALGNAPKEGLRLVPQREPEFVFPEKSEEWVCANDFGAKIGDNEDDAPAFQKAIDEAAKKGASVVYILPSKGGDPNWYWLKKDVRVHGSVRCIMGLAFVRILGGGSDDPNYPENLGKFVVGDDPTGAKTVFFQHLQVFAPKPSFGIEVSTPSRTVVCRNSGGTVIARKNSTVFMTNCVGHLYVEAGATVWARQWNTEGGPEKVGINTRNDGGQLWILGMKTEAKSTKLAVLNGGRAEVLGVHNYNTSGVKDETPFFRAENATLSVAGYREICFGGAWWKTTVFSSQDGEVSKQGSKPWQTWSLLRAGK